VVVLEGVVAGAVVAAAELGGAVGGPADGLPLEHAARTTPRASALTPARTRWQRGETTAPHWQAGGRPLARRYAVKGWVGVLPSG
jgi:hypothetical protein